MPFFHLQKILLDFPLTVLKVFQFLNLERKRSCIIIYTPKLPKYRLTISNHSRTKVMHFQSKNCLKRKFTLSNENCIFFQIFDNLCMSNPIFFYFTFTLLSFFHQEQEEQAKKKLEEEQARQKRELELFEKKMDGKKSKKRNRKVTESNNEKSFWNTYKSLFILTATVVVAMSAYIIMGSQCVIPIV